VRRRLPLAVAAAATAAALAILAILAVLAVGGGSLDMPWSVAPSHLSLASAAATPAPTRAPSPAPTPARPTAAPYVPSSIERAGIVARLQAALDAGRADLAAPGIVASVLFPDGRQWTGVSGVADIASGRPLSPDTPFAIASVSKTFLAAEILLLVEDGRLALDDEVAPLLPTTLVGGVAIDSRITIRMLLDHSSGLGDYLVSPALDRAVRADPAGVWTPDEALAYARPTVAPPNTGYHYANTNYVLLGLIAERLTGNTLAAEFRSRFFEPLGLRSASYQGAEPPAAELPTAYRYSSGRLDATPTDVTDGSAIRPFTSITTAAGAAGSVAASARDLALWARAVYDGRVLETETVALMIGDAEAALRRVPPYPYGLGVQVFTIDERLSYGHSGRLVGARSVVRWFPEEEIAIAITTNQSRFDPTPILVDLLAIVAPQEIGERLWPD
jgi:D-alanyl-D-alanine carboxypeptidase